ncbi:cytochrome C oxidase subunit IV family protein [Croceicoccus mobilis]|uniref:Caa(3)-type oxidase subunit IV n=1 Tax=Croceicoccus mobilis TaxID=1703339 RepID=A0A916Z8E5_9SPHN|nr:cytochrome C oxidase subunit IV family protein [Croceicoccus mobilis]GGD81330.1 hypothetical protein GCM10010990_34080 [Croceicoccus mobilis]
MTGRRGIALTWSVLLMLGFASLSLNGIVAGVRWNFAAVIAVAAAKAIIVAWVFMNIGMAPRGWRIGFAAVIAAIASLVAILHMAT